MMKDVIKETVETYEKIAVEYSQRNLDVKLVEHLLAYFIENLKGKKILDVGCGHGRDAKYLSERGFEVVGIDLSRSLLKIARRMAPKAKFLLMDMRDLKFGDEEFDGIWSCASFLHIPKREALKTLKEFRRVLKPGGLLYLGVKKGEGERMVEKEHYKGGKKFFAFYTEKELKDMLKKVGFKVEEVVIEKKRDTWINVFARKD